MIRLKYNNETDDVEFINDNGNVVDSVGPEVVQSWVEAYNLKYGFVKPEVVAPVVEEKPETQVTEQVAETESTEGEKNAEEDNNKED